MTYWNEKQYWADAGTRNCVWQFQVMHKAYLEDGCNCKIYDDEGDLLEGKTKEDENNCPCHVKVWHTRGIFLTEKEAMEWGNSRPYEWGKFQEGWRIYGVPANGLMAELLAKHTEEFKEQVEYIG